MASEGNKSVEKKISRTELKKQIGIIVNKEIGKLILNNGFIARSIWLGNGRREDKLSGTAELIVKKIEDVNTDEEYKKIKRFLGKFDEGNFSIRDKEALRAWAVVSLIASAEYPTSKIGEIVLQPGNYVREDFLKLVDLIMNQMDVFEPEHWVVEFVSSTSTVDGAFVVESIEKLKERISDFIEYKRKKVDAPN
jgi:hypothetical protein